MKRTLVLSLLLLGGCSEPGGPTMTSDSGGAQNSGGLPSGGGGGLVTGGGGGLVGGAGTGGAGSGGTGVGDGGTGSLTGGSGGAALGTGGGVPGSGGRVGADEPYPVPAAIADEDGSELWLRYRALPIPMRKAEYQEAFGSVVALSTSDTLQAAADELVLGLSGLTESSVSAASAADSGAVVLGTLGNAAADAFGLNDRVTPLGPEGYLVERVPQGAGHVTVILGNSDVGVLYGAFALLRHLQMHGPVDELSLSGAPKIQHRMLNHWDDLDGAVERGYAGRSIWDWSSLPTTVSQRMTDYARANASLGINGVVLTNVNATKGINANMWTQRDQYFPKVKALADTFRPYGIRVFLTAPFNAAGNANPNDPTTRSWWAARMDELYAQIPDFGGLLIKASSEGEPGPSNGASHADGANMLAEAIGDRGIVVWRAFVYGENLASDRIRQAYDEFQPLDGDFVDSAFVQPKNGPLDFQPREPIHPLFGGMPNTNLALELQITKEYLGQDTHLAYLGPMWEEILRTETHALPGGATVARVVDGTAHGNQRTAIAGVANVGNDTNWAGSHFNQANWYAYGRMAWDPDASARSLAEEWVRMTLSNDPELVTKVTDMMMSSHQAVVDYMTPLGLVHIMGTDHHYGPQPWEDSLSRAEWNPVYYHAADQQGIGFDRTSSGSGAVEQYHSTLAQQYSERATVPNDFLLFFHRVGWGETLDTGRSLWGELVHRYSLGVDAVQVLRDTWQIAEQRIDVQRYQEIAEFLEIQHYEARWWRDACLSYFASQGGQQIPAGYATPAMDLSSYQSLANTCPPDRDKPRCMQVYNGDPSPAILP